VGLPDETNENPAPQSANNLGAGTDVLYGWLVGRAAADLGLAQALAANEAQRREQLKGLEESLLAEIRELQDHQAANSGDLYSAAVIDPLKLELERVGARQAQLEAAMNSKLGEFAAQIRQQAESFSSGNADDLKFELKLLADRIARAEFAAQRAQAQALSEGQRIENIIVERFQAEAAADKAPLIDELQAHGAAPNESVDWEAKLNELSERIGRLESSSSPSALADERLRWSNETDKRMDALVDEVGAQLRAIGGAKADGESHVAELAAVVERLARLEQTTLIDDSATKHLGETIHGRITELQEKLTTALSVVDQRDGEIGAFYGRFSALADKVSELAERGVDRAELAEFKAELSRDDVKSAQTLIHDVEENFGAKIRALESELTGELQRSQSRDGLMNEIRSEIQLLGRRWVQTETSAQQTHGLIANELAQAAQLRDGMVGELTALQSQLTDRQERDQRIENLGEDLNARIFDVQAQLSQNLATLVSRDAEIAALKIQVEHLAQMATAKSAVPLVAPNRLHTAIAATVGLGGLKPQPEALPALQPASATEQEPGNLLQRYDADPAGAKEEKKQLQQRISADIERVRAELRKRAGVGR
jgi:hypothetical protein